MGEQIAIVGMACRFPGASSPERLWENALAQRSAFRRIPPERLRLEDYFAPERSAEDRTYSFRAALLEDWEFDRTRFRVSGDAFRCSDPAHWLALEVASDALADAGFEAAEGLPRGSVGVYIGNTLTGDYSRANSLRLRWPYARRAAQAALSGEGIESEVAARVLENMEREFKAPFPPTGDETLAGSLSNTIAGRICNYFDLHGGGYTVDGACASSLIAIANACAALEHGEIDAAIAGGVDLSLDPFELVGFAKAGALAADRMLVYDERSSGFLPGEGCGLVVLMRRRDAESAGRRIRAVVAGWGVSSDGSGGLTRPEAEGQRLAIERAWRRADRSLADAAYFEGHGTGTAVGDTAELAALARAREAAGSTAAVAIGSVKALIGHCKAAAGAAGLIKAAMTLASRTLPPTAGCERPHRELTRDGRMLRFLDRAEEWTAREPMTAGVSAMGFGGINVHLALEEVAPARPAAIRELARSAQDAELFVFAGESKAELLSRIGAIAALAAGMSDSDLTDSAADLARGPLHGNFRAAVVASNAGELADLLERVRAALQSGAPAPPGAWIGEGSVAPRIGFLFPGQGSPSHGGGGAWRRRFDRIAEIYAGAAELRPGEIATQVTQPAIVRASLAGLRVLGDVGLDADIAVGHSLGELTALHWSGQIGEKDLLRLAERRGMAMSDPAIPTGAMAAIAAGPDGAASLIGNSAVAVAAFNSANQTALSGAEPDIERILSRARGMGIRATRIPVSHAFHSPLMARAAEAFARDLAAVTFGPRVREIASTVTGSLLNGHDVREVLARQFTAPVRFVEAVSAAGPVDLWIECGPGAVLTNLIREGGAAAQATDACGGSLRGLLEAIGAAFALGAPVRPAALFEDRFTRPIRLDRRPTFLTNPCEKVLAGAAPVPATPAATAGPSQSIAETLRRIAAAHAELPAAAVHGESRMLSDLHLNSIVVGRIVADTCKELGIAVPVALTEFADSSLSAIAAALEERREAKPAEERHPAGVATWVRLFRSTRTERALPAARAGEPAGRWEIVAAEDDPRREQVDSAMKEASGSGVVLLLPPRFEAQPALLLRAAKRALENRGRFVMAQQGHGAASFARTLHLEAPDIATRIVNVARWDERASQWIAAEACSAGAFAEAHYDESGRRFEPYLEAIAAPKSTAPALTPGNLLLITGGGKGIAAECGLALARRTGVRLALVGRAHPADDAELAANLARIRSFVPASYYSADVTDAAAVAGAARAIAGELGPVTAFLHGAGANTPRRIAQLDEDSFRRTLAPKVDGLSNVLSALDPERLRLLIGFGSIIARTGLPGEADYAVANERLAQLIEEWGEDHPHCRALTLEWSVWSGVGMGERLGRIEALVDRGITPISPDRGVAALIDAVGSEAPERTVVVAGRFGLPVTAPMRSTLPFRRFLQNVRVHYPGVELVAEAAIAAESDPHILDHEYRGQPMLAAVMGLEAMAQAAMALAGWSDPPAFEDVRLARPVNCPATIRVAALMREDGGVDVVLRSSESGFQADHFIAVCRPFAAAGEAPSPASHADFALDAADLYGPLWFQEGRYRRTLGYRTLRARECAVAIESREDAWFDLYAPPALDLGDPGARDAALHSIQACIPHRTVLPSGVDRIRIFDTVPCARLVSRARERMAQGDTFVYDVEIRTEDGVLRERWEGLRLTAVEERGEWPAPLNATYLERRLTEAAPWADAEISLSRAPAAMAAGHRPDGKPDGGMSFSRSGPYRLSIRTQGAAGCDIEAIRPRAEEEWRDLLGPARFALASEVAVRAAEDLSAAGTRVWCAIESLKKAGLPCDAPLTVRAVRARGSVELASGALLVVSCPVRLPEPPELVICCIALEPTTHAANI